MIKLKDLLLEHLNDKNIQMAQAKLLDWFDYTNWKDFVDHQSLGDCQNIVGVIEELPLFESHFGHIKTDEPYYSSENDEMIDVMTHHWVSLNGVPYEFSKGTLKEYIHFDDLYNVNVEDVSRYYRLKGNVPYYKK
jgi:hypothetical protein